MYCHNFLAGESLVCIDIYFLKVFNLAVVFHGVINNLNKCWSHIAPFSRLYFVKVFVQLKSQR